MFHRLFALSVMFYRKWKHRRRWNTRSAVLEYPRFERPTAHIYTYLIMKWKSYFIILYPFRRVCDGYVPSRFLSLVEKRSSTSYHLPVNRMQIEKRQRRRMNQRDTHVYKDKNKLTLDYVLIFLSNPTSVYVCTHACAYARCESILLPRVHCSRFVLHRSSSHQIR